MAYSIVLKKTIAALADMTEEQQQVQFGVWAKACYNWMNAARQAIAKSKSLQNALKKYTPEDPGGEAGQIMQQFANSYKINKVAKGLEDVKDVLIGGYNLLNDIGEWVRGDELDYSVTLSTDGSLLGAGGDTLHQLYTFTVPRSEFVKMFNMSGGELRMKSAAAIFRQFDAQIQANQYQSSWRKDKLAYEMWSEQKMSQLSYFSSQVNIRNWQNTGIQKGNLLVGYLNFTDNGKNPSNVHWAREHAYWRSLYYTMQNAASLPKEFYKGGNVENELARGLDGYVTNIRTLITTISKVLNIFTSFSSGYEVISKHIKKTAIPGAIEKTINTTQTQVADKLIDMFSKTVPQQIIINA